MLSVCIYIIIFNLLIPNKKTNLIHDLAASYRDRSCHGQPNLQCRHCNAVFWHGETVKSLYGNRNIIYNKC
jgi:hypothetical protein